MSSGVDVSEPRPPGPGMDPEPGRELVLPLERAPAPQLEVSAADAEARAPQLEVSAAEAEAPAPQLEVSAAEAEVRAPQLDVSEADAEARSRQRKVSAADAEAPAPAPQLEVPAAEAEVRAPQLEVSAADAEESAPQQEVFAAEAAPLAAVVTIVISQPGEEAQAREVKAVGLPSPEAEDGKARDASVSVTAAVAAKEAELARSDSFDDYEQCRVCQQKTEEPLVDLGCRCRGDLAKAHRTCIDVWFRTRGSNKCEICQQVAVNIPPPETQASTSYWVWRVDSTYGRGQGGRERGWFSPLWVAFAILIGGLLLDVLISVSLGVSALPVNIIIGVLIVLGLGTALRLALECCQEWGSRRNVARSMPRLENIPPTGYHPAVV
ncbi:hypothetical protein ACP4OV_011188 [Aristida adscensionis]